MKWIRRLLANKSSRRARHEAPRRGNCVPCDSDDLLSKWKNALTEHRRRELDSAATAYLEIIHQCPGALSARDNLATIYNDQGQHDDALAQLQHALHPFYGNSQVTLGVTYLHLDREDEGLAAFRKAAEGSVGGLAKGAWSNVCVILSGRGEHCAAIEAGRKALEQDDRDLNALANLVSAYVQAGRSRDAETLLRTVPNLQNIDWTSTRGIQQCYVTCLCIWERETGMLRLLDPKTDDIIILHGPGLQNSLTSESA